MEHLTRIVNAFRHKASDHTPYFEYCLYSKDITNTVLGRPCAYLHSNECIREKGWKEGVKQIAIDHLDIAEFFDHDLIYVTMNSLPPVNVSPMEPIAAQEEIDDPVAKVIRQNEKKRQFAGELNKDNFLVYKLLRDEMERRENQIPILAPAYGHGVWTDIDLMQTMALAPEVAHEHFSLATQKMEKVIDKYLELGIKVIGIGGDFAGNSPLISPEHYRQFIVPELRKLSEIIHRAEAYAINASDGNLWSVIDAFLIESGVDAYLEIDLHAGMDLKKLKEGYGDRITFLGNMDCGNTLSFASPDEIRAATIKCIEDGLGNGGHIFTASNAIIDSVPPENYFAMVNAFRNYWKLPPLKYV